MRSILLFCFAGADFIASLWTDTNDCDFKHECTLDAAEMREVLSGLHGVYRLEIVTNTIEGHAFVAHFNGNTVCIYDTLGGCVGFYKAIEQRATWIDTFCAFSTLPADDQPAAYAALFGFTLDMAQYLQSLGHLTIVHLKVGEVLRISNT